LGGKEKQEGEIGFSSPKEEGVNLGEEEGGKENAEEGKKFP